MSKSTSRILSLLGVAMPLLLLADLRPAEATCGGGGGGGMGGGSSSGGTSGTGKAASYPTSWTSRYEDAVAKATEARKAIILYFLPEGVTEAHPVFYTKVMQDISKEHPVVQFAYSKDNPLRAEYKVPKDQHAVYVCDWFANSMKLHTVRTAKDKFPLPSIEYLVGKIRPTVDALLKKLETGLKHAEKSIERPDAPAALKDLGDLVHLKGHEISERAKPVIKKIEAAATQEIDEALKVEDKKARGKALEKIKARFKGLRSAEERCAKEIEAATGMAPARDTDSALVRGETAQVVDAMLASVDWSRRAPSIAERAHKAMNEGLQAEIREEYERALELYAQAVGLDPKDSIALTYLGELYRHHLGRWTEAKQVFERVLELNNDDLAVAVALHGLGKMTIWEGNNEAGLKYFAESLRRRPTALCYRNLAVFWNTEKEFKKAFGYATQAFTMDPQDPYNQVFYAIYLILDGQKEKAEAMIAKAQYDPSMAYNFACYYAAQGNRDLVMKYLHRHFYGYEKYDDVRRFEMAEARMDIHFQKYKEDPKFLELTALAAK